MPDTEVIREPETDTYFNRYVPITARLTKARKRRELAAMARPDAQRDEWRARPPGQMEHDGEHLLEARDAGPERINTHHLESEGLSQRR